MKGDKILTKFATKEGGDIILRTLRKNELEELRRLFIHFFPENDLSLHALLKNRQKHSSFFIGAFSAENLVGFVFGWPDGVLVVHGIAVLVSFRRKGIGTALLRAFEDAAKKEGFESLSLGARWEAIPFYLSYGLTCFANVQIKSDRFPWNNIQHLQSKYDVLSAAVFGPLKKSNLISRLNRKLNLSVRSVKADFESISVQVKPSEISKEALEIISEDFCAYSTQFAFRKNIARENYTS